MDSLILWDIDGTLLNSQRPPGKSLHCQALCNLGLAVNEPKFNTSGVTDSEILSKILEQEGIEYDLALLRESLESLDSESKSMDSESKFEICPGIVEFFRSETARSFTHGILTGNTLERTMSKLGAVDLLDTFNLNLMFTCGVGENRTQIAANAKAGIEFRNFHSIIVIGDTPADIEVARALNVYCVAVASGKYDLDELTEFKPDLTISNFRENSNLVMSFLKLRLN
jgi:phosphoglycolate phosphatase